MYRYIVDNAITYTPDDLVLFRESPFAVWMERLTLENPEHGIPPDLDSIGALPQSPQQDDIIATLRSEGRNVALIDAEDDEPDRRVATLESMRVGADFIVNGQLAVGDLAGAVDLLMRTSGNSELGDYLYIPCETRVDDSLQSPFRLCFAAEQLANLQGQLPAQMLIIRDGAEVVPLQTDDHIYYYRAVEKRFLSAMNIFRKHRMPDPAESAHFGRWAECAGEVLKQRALSEPQHGDQPAEEVSEAVVEMPQLRVASGAGAGAQCDVDVAGRQEFATANYKGKPGTVVGTGSGSDVTLAEQARLLKPDSYSRGTPPGHTPSLARIGKPRFVVATKKNADVPPVDPVLDEFSPDEALDNLDFIGSGPTNINGAKFPEMDLGEAVRAAPAPNLRDTSKHETEASLTEIKSGALQLPEREPRPPFFLPPNQNDSAAGSAPEEQLNPHLRDSGELWIEDSSSVIDLDSAPATTLAPVVQRAEAVFKRLIRDDPMFKKVNPANSKPERAEEKPPSVSALSDSLHTSEEFKEN